MSKENKLLEDKKAIEDKIIGERRRSDSFRRANDIRYKKVEELKEYQKPLFYEIKIREEIQALDDEIELAEFNKSVNKKE
jgi:hypothetical protein